jgi:nicotinamidase-related amidase
MPLSKSRDLHGAAPDKSAVALLLIDWINDLEFDSGAKLLPHALKAAKATAALRKRAKEAGVPVIYCNDNFGRWRSDFRATLEHVLKDGVRGQPVAELLAPDEHDYFVLKPKHSGFFDTTLDTLLGALRVRRLILTGIAGNICVLFTANDAYMRDLDIYAPADCIVSNTAVENDNALQQIGTVLKGELAPSTQLQFRRASRQGKPRHRLTGRNAP